MASATEPTSLASVLAGLLSALSQAEHLADVEAAKLAIEYRSDPQLAEFQVPAFGISEADLTLRFFVVAAEKLPGGSNDLLIITSPEALKDTPPDRISELTIRVAPTPFRVVEQAVKTVRGRR